MKRGLATFLTGIMTVTLVAAALTGCGSSTADKRSEKVRLMVWSPSEDQSKDSGEWLQTMCNTFAKEHPEWDMQERLLLDKIDYEKGLLVMSGRSVPVNEPNCCAIVKIGEK